MQTDLSDSASERSVYFYYLSIRKHIFFFRDYPFHIGKTGQQLQKSIFADHFAFIVPQIDEAHAGAFQLQCRGIADIACDIDICAAFYHLRDKAFARAGAESNFPYRFVFIARVFDYRHTIGFFDAVDEVFYLHIFCGANPSATAGVLFFRLR